MYYLRSTHSDHQDTGRWREELAGKEDGGASRSAQWSPSGLTGCFPDTSATPPSDPLTNELFQSLNRDRASVGLPPLTWSPKLANNAGSWA